MMKLTHSIVAAAFLFGAGQASACGFRLSDGNLLKCGMARIELLSLVGAPVTKDLETQGVDIGGAEKGETIETWAYKLKGDIGGDYLVSLTLANGKVIAINRKQLGRL